LSGRAWGAATASLILGKQSGRECLDVLFVRSAIRR